MYLERVRERCQEPYEQETLARVYAILSEDNKYVSVRDAVLALEGQFNEFQNDICSRGVDIVSLGAQRDLLADILSDITEKGPYLARDCTSGITSGPYKNRDAAWKAVLKQSSSGWHYHLFPAEFAEK